MQDLINYIQTYGQYDFNERPFNEIDNVIFSQIVYIDFEGILDNSKALTLSETAEAYHSIYSDDDIRGFIKITSKAVTLLDECARVKRFSDIILCHYVNSINGQIDKQFATLSFLLCDNTINVAFRGTDITVTGVKESAMLSYMFPVPAQIEALHHFQETCMCYDRNIRIMGHSKGGNLAVFAGVSCSNSLKKRITDIYENDAPGFPAWFFARYDYIQIKDKIKALTPQSSIVGRLLFSDVKPSIVFSTNYGLRQHQVSSWKIIDNEFVKVSCYDEKSDFMCEYFNNLIDTLVDDDLELFFETLEYLFENIGIDDFYDLKAFDIKKLHDLIDSRSALDEIQKQRFKQIIKIAVSDLTHEFISQHSKSILSRFKQKENLLGY